MIKTVVFDLVNVLLDYSWENWALETYGEDMLHALQQVLWKTGYWEELDRGTWETEYFLERCIEKAPELEKEIRESVQQFGDGMKQFYYVIPWIQELKSKGYQVLYLSNYPEILRQNHPEVLDFIPYMDGGIFSCDVKLVKPEADIYVHLCQEYHLEPVECMFLDDTLRNVKAAQACGMRALQFTNYEEIYPKVMTLLKES